MAPLQTDGVCVCFQEEISSPMNGEIFDFCDPELFSETLQNSEFNCCNYEQNSSYVTNQSHSTETDHHNNKNNGNETFIASAATNLTTNSSSNLSAMFDSQEELELENDISASIDFSPSASFSMPQYVSIQSGQHEVSQVQALVVDPMMQCPMAPVATLIDDCLSSLSSYMPLNPCSPSCSFVGTTMAPNYLAAASMNPAASSVESCGMFPLLGAEFPPQDLDYQGDNCGGLYSQDCMQGTFNPQHLQVLLLNSPLNFTVCHGC